MRAPACRPGWYRAVSCEGKVLAFKEYSKVGLTQVQESPASPPTVVPYATARDECSFLTPTGGLRRMAQQVKEAIAGDSRQSCCDLLQSGRCFRCHDECGNRDARDILMRCLVARRRRATVQGSTLPTPGRSIPAGRRCHPRLPSLSPFPWRPRTSNPAGYGGCPARIDLKVRCSVSLRPRSTRPHNRSCVARSSCTPASRSRTARRPDLWRAAPTNQPCRSLSRADVDRHHQTLLRSPHAWPQQKPL